MRKGTLFYVSKYLFGIWLNQTQSRICLRTQFVAISHILSPPERATIYLWENESENRRNTSGVLLKIIPLLRIPWQGLKNSQTSQSCCSIQRNTFHLHLRRSFTYFDATSYQLPEQEELVAWSELELSFAPIKMYGCRVFIIKNNQASASCMFHLGFSVKQAGGHYILAPGVAPFLSMVYVLYSAEWTGWHMTTQCHHVQVACWTATVSCEFLQWRVQTGWEYNGHPEQE